MAGPAQDTPPPKSPSLPAGGCLETGPPWAEKLRRRITLQCPSPGRGPGRPQGRGLGAPTPRRGRTFPHRGWPWERQWGGPGGGRPALWSFCGPSLRYSLCGPKLPSALSREVSEWVGEPGCRSPAGKGWGLDLNFRHQSEPEWFLPSERVRGFLAAQSQGLLRNELLSARGTPSLSLDVDYSFPFPICGAPPPTYQ